MVDKTADSIHKSSRDAAAYLEAIDKEEFGKDIREDENGCRIAKMLATSSEYCVGVTANKIKTLLRDSCLGMEIFFEVR